jgi:hypothetical protein
MRKGCVLVAFLVVAVALIGRAAAVESLPIKGPFGEVDAQGCQSLHEETEGAYVVFNEDGKGYGSGGECACQITSFTKKGSDYELNTSCRCIDSPETKDHATLTIVSDDEIVLEGSKYERCKD